jgi:peptide chain release factor 3
MKRKQFAKGMTQIAQEGAIQMFFEPGASMERVTVGVVGTLQFDVLKFRMKSEYNVDYISTPQPYQAIRRIVEPANPQGVKFYDNKWVQDVRGNNYVLFQGEYMIRWFLDQNPGVVLSEFGE